MVDTDKEKKEAENADKKVVSSCSISIDDIFRLLHLKAIKEVKECKILNSVIEGDGKNAKFHGAGSHIIAALPLKGDVIEMETAIKGLIQYVTWFNGPDVAKNITKDTVWPLEDNNTNDSNNTTKESITFEIPSFKTYLIEAGEATTDAEEDNKKALKNSQDRHDIGEKAKLADKAQNKPAKGFYITYKIAIEGQKESPLSDALKGFGAGLLKGLGVQGFSWKTGAKGKEHTIGDLLDTLDKVFGKIDPNELKTRFTKNIQTKYPQTKNTDVTFLDLKTILQHLKGKLATKEQQQIKTANYSLCYKVEKNDKSAKLINTTVIADCITRSIKGLFKKFKNKVDAKDVILVNDYSENDKDLKKIEKKLDVNTNDKKPLTTDSMKVRSGKMLSEDDKKDKANDTSTDKKQEANLRYVNERLPKIAADVLKDNFEKDASTKVYTKTQLKSIISETDEPDLFKELSDKPDSSGTINYAYVIKTLWYEFKNTNDKPTGESIDHSTVNSMLKMLFEEADDKNDKAEKLNVDELNSKIEQVVNNAFKILFEDAKLKETNGKDYKPVDFKVYSILAKDDLSENKDKKKTVADSLKINYSFVNSLFESNAFNDELQTILNEANTTYVDKIIHKIEEAGIESIKANKKAITDKFDLIINKKKKSIDYLDGIKKEEKKIEITFIDRDPNELKPDKEITTIEKEEGKEIEPPEPPKHAGYTFKEWDPDPADMEESGKTYTAYEEDTNGEEDEIEITYMDIDDPSKQDTEDEYYEMEKKVKENDDDAKAPTPKDKEGWKFKEWDPNPDDMTKSEKTFAKYEEKPKEDESKVEKKYKYWICPDVNKYLTPKELSIKLNHTDTNFYIVPMKGLKMNTTDDDDSKEVEGKGK